MVKLSGVALKRSDYEPTSIDICDTEDVGMVKLSKLIGRSISATYRWLKDNSTDVYKIKGLNYVKGRDVKTAIYEERKNPKRWGAFYLIQLIPDISPNRIKAGFSFCFDERIKVHKNTNPNAVLLKRWRSLRHWESIVLDDMWDSPCCLPVSKTHTEVFDCTDINRMIERCNHLFSILEQKL